MQLLGSGFEYSYLLVDQTHGGILLAWRSAVWSVGAISIKVISLSAKLRPVMGGIEWWLTTVYGSCFDVGKPYFLAELNDMRTIQSGPWLICGDFNMVYRANDKNNGRVNRRLMGQFRRFLNEGALQEIHLNGRLFTWSNERVHPTLERIDRVLISNEWEELFPSSELHSLASLCSDHVSVLQQCDAAWSSKCCFHFRAFWPKCAGFMEIIERAWHYPLQEANPFRNLN
jgi:hypothetical protein